MKDNLVNKIRNSLREIIISEDFRFDYDRGDFKPPGNVIGTAKRAIEAVKKQTSTISNGGNEGTGLQKAKKLASGEGINHGQLKRMKAFFDKNSENIKRERASGKNIYNSELIQKWNLWGGDEAQRWVNSKIGSVKDTNQSSKDLRPKGTKTLMDPFNTRVRE